MIPKSTIPNGYNLKYTQSQMDLIAKGLDPEWTRSQKDTIPDWKQSRMEMIPNGHDPEETQSRIDTISRMDTTLIGHDSE